jgi:hypothetical protein
MLTSRHLLGSVAILALCTTTAFSALTVDGTASLAEGYDGWLIDTNPEPDPTDKYIGTGLDIDTMYFANVNSSRYVAMTVDPINNTAPFDLDGSPPPDSWTGTTGLSIAFSANAVTLQPSYIINMLLSPGPGGVGVDVDRLEIYEWNGAWVYTNLLNPVYAGTWDLAVAAALELRLDEGLLIGSPASAQYVRAQLDDTGNWDDDQIAGPISFVPEPATAGLLAIGTVGLLLRRRQRQRRA